MRPTPCDRGIIRAGWKEQVAKAEAAGVRVIPYLDGRIFDPADPDGSFWKDRALRFACNATTEAEPDGAGEPNREEFDDVGPDPRHPYVAAVCSFAPHRLDLGAVSLL